MAYYDRLLRSVMEMLEGAVKIMKVDGLSEEVENLGKALLALEDARSALVRERASSIIVSKEQGQPRGTEGRME